MTTIKKNLFYVLIQQFILLGLPFLTIPYISRVLGPNGVGHYSYSFSYVTLLINVFLLGSNLYGVREIAKVKSNPGQLSRTFSEIYWIRTGLLMLGTLFYLSCVLFLWEGDKVFYWQTLHFIAAFFDITWLFQGLEQFKKVVTRNITLKLLGFVSVFLFVKDEHDVVLYTIIMGASVLIGNVALFYQLSRSVRFTRSMDGFKRHLKQMFILFIPSFSAMIYSVLDKTMLGFLSSTTQVGYYEQAYKIVYMISSLINISGTVMLPRTSSLIAENQFDKLHQILRDGVTFTLFLVFPIMFGFLVIAKDFVQWFLGNQFQVSGTIAMIMAPVIIFKSLGVIFGSWYLVPMNKNKEYTLPIVIGALLNLILNFLLIPKYGAVGAASATTVTEGVILAVQLWFLKNVIKPNWKMKKGIIMYLLASIVMAILVIVLSGAWPTSLLLKIVLKFLFGGMIYILMLLLLREELARNLVKKLFLFKLSVNEMK
ncbi:flippase [Neobacillus sedimentimangrovi]|uniref:Flippase n=1 Tax=Neobacillus sedimentimangrovi TaxID=2699460 RepID=A0ABS8QFI4_9BACI|nr:flippase [Neobacillus sedimentimangrovi]MCD4837998.1 flippase [Neobacillus sedimentimangrovi]